MQNIGSSNNNNNNNKKNTNKKHTINKKPPSYIMVKHSDNDNGDKDNIHK